LSPVPPARRLIGRWLCHRLLCGRFGIRTAEQCLLLAGFGLGGDRLERGGQFPLQALLTPFVMRAGMHHDRPIWLLVEIDRSLIHPVGCSGAVLGLGAAGDAANLGQLIGVNGVEYDTLAFVVGCRKTRDEPLRPCQVLFPGRAPAT